MDRAHAVDQMAKLVEVQKKCTQAQRGRWLLKAKAHLHQGEVEEVEQMCKQIAKGKSKRTKRMGNTSRIHTHRMYYEQRQV